MARFDFRQNFDTLMTQLIPQTSFTAIAMLIGRHLDLRRFQARNVLADLPLTLKLDEGVVVLFRFGAVVFFGVPVGLQWEFLTSLQPILQDPVEDVETETLPIRIEPGTREKIQAETLILPEADLNRLQIVADILAKSVLLADQEARVAKAFERIAPMAESLSRGSGRYRAKELIRHIGETLLIQHQMVGRAEIGDKPEILWEHPQLEGLFLRLENEYEIRERHAALERKLGLIGDTAATLLELLQNQRSLRVEWYIVVLIVVEILLYLYEMFLA